MRNVQFISAPSDIAYTLKMQGYQEGSFALDVDKQTGNEITESTSFQGIPSSTTTIVTMDVPVNLEVENSTLKIDNNGDEMIDKTLNANPDGIIVYDVTPPEISISYNIENKKVIFSAIDISPTAINHSNTNITATDNQNNISILNFTKYKEKPTKLKLSFNTIERNGISTIFPNTNIQYDWKEKDNKLTDLDTKITIKGIEKYIFNYNKAKDITTIKEKIGKNITITKKEGFVVVTLKTSEDDLNVSH